MCSNCSGDYENPDATANVQLCECGHDVELHDSCGCQVVSLTFRCKCKRTIEQLLWTIDVKEQAISVKINELPDFCSQYEYGYAVHHQEWINKHSVRHSIDTETFRCSCGKLMCGSCGGCSSQCQCLDKEIH